MTDESADAALGAQIADYDDLLVSLTAEVARTYVLVREFEERIKLVVGNIDYPPIVAQAVEKKLAAQQLLEEKVTQKEIAKKEERSLNAQIVYIFKKFIEEYFKERQG